MHNCDEIDEIRGQLIVDFIEAGQREINAAAVYAEEIHRTSGFLVPIQGEEETDFHRRLIASVESRLGPVLVACLMGSRRYNLHFVDSDRDLLVVYASKHIVCREQEEEEVEEEEEEGGVAPEEPQIKNPTGVSPDYTIMEAATFRRMLAQGKPFLVESLYLTSGHDDVLLHAGLPWESLVEQRQRFLSHDMVRQYLSDGIHGKAGLQAVRRGKKPHKHRKILYVAYRSLENALQVCRERTLRIWRERGSPEWERIMSIRRGEGEIEDLCRVAEGLFEQLNIALEASSLPAAESSAGPAKAWLRQVRKWAAAIDARI